MAYHTDEIAAVLHKLYPELEKPLLFLLHGLNTDSKNYAVPANFEVLFPPIMLYLIYFSKSFWFHWSLLSGALLHWLPLRGPWVFQWSFIMLILCVFAFGNRGV